MTYSKVFESLNDAQKQAVQYIDGPLLVVAGPGTGKTQLLSARAANILSTTDTDSRNILCLTFTNKAALNMRERLIEITDGKARDVTVRTFHSFASEIMNMYPDYFWNGARLSTAPDAVQLDILQNILSELPLDNPLALKFSGQFTLIPDVLQGLKLTKEAGLTPDKLRAIINANLAYIDQVEPALCEITAERLSVKNLQELSKKIDNLPDQPIDTLLTPLISLASSIRESLTQATQLDEQIGKTTHTGAWKRQWVQTIAGERGMHTERSRNEWWLNLADVYDAYRTELHKRGYYDYSDMLVEVLTQLENRPDMLADIQERFLYVMIDEFQDTNSAQLRLAHLVSDHHTSEGRPNLMAVGDDDQSIFKFNGAELSNMLSFRRSYPTCKTIVLKDNYRSSQAILDIAEKVIDLAEDRLVHRDTTLTKKLEAKNPPTSSLISHINYRSREEQLFAVAREIAEKFSKEESTAVIARSHDSLRQIASALLGLNIPVHYEQQRNILEHPLVNQVCLLSQIIEAIQNGDIEYVNMHLSETLRHPMWNIDPKTLWQLALDNFKEPNWLDSLSDHKDKNIQNIAELLFELSQACSSEPLAVCLEYILGLRSCGDHTSPVRKFYVEAEEKGSDYLHGLSAIKKIRDLANEFSATEKASLPDFVAFIQLEIANEAIIVDESPFVSGEHAVSLLSVHKAKGLEFDNVYIIDAVENFWQPRKGGRKPPANLPLQPTGDNMDDYARLMFVAITRAKANLHISSYRYDQNGQEVLTSSLISNVLPANNYQKAVPPVEVLAETLSWPRLETKNEKQLLAGRLETYTLSVTHLLNFLDVTSGGPQLFLERNLLRLPQAKSSSLAHGTATHAALEYAQKLTNSDEFDLEKVKQAYINALGREHLPSSESTRYKKHGPELLEKLFKNNLLDLKKGSAPEQNINDALLGTARLGGKLDRIDITDNSYIISDYKTGRPLNNFETKDSSQMVKAWKQKTQLIYYAILLQNSSRYKLDNKQIIGQMIYLDANTKKDMYRTYEPTAEDVDRLAKLTKVIFRKIISLDLPDITKYPQDITGVLQFEDDLLKQA